MTMRNDNPLLALKALGQSVWLDDLRRRWLEDGSLARLVESDGLAGVTSNPSIFHKAIAESHDYDRAIDGLAERGASASEIYESIVVEDVRGTADLLRPVYEKSAQRDGYVSLEVSPHLAYDPEGTCEEAARLWRRVDRANLMIKVPATHAGLPAVRRLIADGINVNVTLLFGVDRYREAADAHLAGLEDRAARGKALDHVASVASFFLSRIDVRVDERLDALATPEAWALRGQTAIVCARLAYQAYKHRVETPRWRALAGRGAQPQRLLWASTGTKDARYSDVKYVEALIGPGTVNTMPLRTLEAFRDHGQAGLTLEADLKEAWRSVRRLAHLGIVPGAVAEQLESEGVRKFIEPFDRLHALIGRRREPFKAVAPHAG
jgi:transaldolase